MLKTEKKITKANLQLVGVSCYSIALNEIYPDKKTYQLALSFRTGNTSENEKSYLNNLERHIFSSGWIEKNKLQKLQSKLPPLRPFSSGLIQLFISNLNDFLI